VTSIAPTGAARAVEPRSWAAIAERLPAPVESYSILASTYATASASLIDLPVAQAAVIAGSAARAATAAVSSPNASYSSASSLAPVAASIASAAPSRRAADSRSARRAAGPATTRSASTVSRRQPARRASSSPIVPWQHPPAGEVVGQTLDDGGLARLGDPERLRDGGEEEEVEIGERGESDEVQAVREVAEDLGGRLECEPER